MAKRYNEEDGVWRTVGGRRIFIKYGQSLSEAMKESGKFKTDRNTKYNEKKDDRDEKLRRKGFNEEEIESIKRDDDFRNGRIDNDEYDRRKALGRGIEDVMEKNKLTEQEERTLRNTVFEQQIDEMYNRFHGKTDKQIAEEIAKERGERILTDKEQKEREVAFMKNLEKEAETSKSSTKRLGRGVEDMIENNKEAEKPKTGRWRYEGWGEDYHKQEGDTYSEIIGQYENGSSSKTKKSDELVYQRTDYKLDKNGNIDYKTGVTNTYKTLDEAKRGATKTYSSSDLKQGMPYTIDYGNGIKKTAIFLGKDDEGHNQFYDGSGITGTFAFSDKFINDRKNVRSNEDDDEFMRLYNKLMKGNKKKK